MKVLRDRSGNRQVQRSGYPLSGKQGHERSATLSALQQHFGNRTVQRLLADRRSLVMRLLNHVPLTTLTNLLQREGAGSGGGTLSSGAGPGAITIEEPEYSTFAIGGDNLAEVTKNLGNKEWGQCHYDLLYTYEANANRVRKVDVTLKLAIQLPQWTELAQATPAAQQEWQRMLTALRAHEEKHAAIARQWAPILQRRLLGQRVAQVEAAYQRVLTKVKRATAQYDQKSDHGRREGVTLHW